VSDIVEFLQARQDEGGPKSKALAIVFNYYAPPDPHRSGVCADCDLLYAVAELLFSEHPGYRQEWAL
jgi:hypothetical protein